MSKNVTETPDGEPLLRTITLTDSAIARVSELLAAEEDNDLMLRVYVNGGGCSGFQYGFDLDDRLGEDDQVFEKDGIKVVIDMMSLGMLGGSEVDFNQTIMSAAFSINNPNVTASCGCGSSFAI